MRNASQMKNVRFRSGASAACSALGVLVILATGGLLIRIADFAPPHPNALYLAASSDDLEHFALLVSRLPDVDAPDYLGHTPLAIAAAHGRRDAVEMLLSRGASVDAGHPLLGTPLMLALANGHEDIARLLLARGADVNARVGGFDPLLCAVRADSPACLQLVLESGADLARPRRYNPLTIAVNDQSTDTLERLLQAGVDPNAPCDDGTTPLFEAVEQRAMSAARVLLLAGADADRAGPNGVTPRALAHRLMPQRELIP